MGSEMCIRDSPSPVISNQHKPAYVSRTQLQGHVLHAAKCDGASYQGKLLVSWDAPTTTSEPECMAGGRLGAWSLEPEEVERAWPTLT